MPSREGFHLASGLINYSALYSEQPTTKYDNKIARSSEFRSLLIDLSERVPSAMNRLLKLASRKCEESLRMKKKTRNSRKRASPSDRFEKNVKRNKTTCATEEETAPSQRVAESDSMTQKRENSLRDDSEETAVDAEPTKNNCSTSVISSYVLRSQQGDTMLVPTKYQIELGLGRKTPAIEAYVRATLLTLITLTTRPQFNIHDEIAKILTVTPFLEFYKTKRQLHQYLENREKMPGEKLQTRTCWNVSDPSEILDGLENVKRNTTDNKIHRAYGQTMLFSSVNNQVVREYTSTVTGHQSSHIKILEHLAVMKAGPVSETEIKDTISSYKYEYDAGRKWSAVIDWFGGSGIVLIFVTAGIGSNYVITEWTKFQRECMKHIAGLLPSIGGLVKTLGPEALEVYCRDGCLGPDCVDRVKMATFTEPDSDEELGDTQSDSDEELEDIQSDSEEEPEDGSDYED